MDTAVPATVTLAEPAAAPASPIPADRISELYRGEIFTEETARVARDRIHWMCAQCDGQRVLDVGCSQGIASILLARDGFDVTAIDTHPDSVAFARREFAAEAPLVQQRLTLIETDLASLPEQPGYDTIVLGEVIEHQVRPDRLLRAAKARLNPGGRLIVTTPFALHPHPDHKVSLFPRDLVEFARGIGLAVTKLQVDGDYMRCVMVAPAEAGPQPDAAEVLRLTEAATLDSQQRLFSRLDERSEQLKKKTDAVRITQRKLAEATASLEAKVHEHAVEVKALRVTHQRAIDALRAEHVQALDTERQNVREAVAKAASSKELEQAKAAHERRVRELHTQLEAARAEARAAEMAHSHERARLRDYNERLKQRLAEAKANLLATKAQTSHQLGRVLVRGVKSPGALLRLPGQLWSLWRSVRERRQTRDRLMTHLDPVAALQSDGTAPVRRSAPAGAAKPTAGSTKPIAAAPAAAGLAGLEVEALKARIESGDMAGAKAQLLAAQGHVDAKALAFRMLQVGKAISESGLRDEEFALACAALEVDRSDQTLRGFFWAAQRTRQFEAACRTIGELERLYGAHPTPDQQAVLAKLHVSPAYQLSVLDLVVDKPTAPLHGVAGRICYVLHNSLPYSSGGYGTRSHGVAGGMLAAGHEVVVLTRPGFPVDIKAELSDADVPAEDLIDGIRYVRTLEPRRKGMSMLQYVTAAADALERQMRRVQPQVVISASNHVTALPALVAARRLGLPFVYEVRGLWEITRISREQEFEDTPAFAVQSLLEAKVAQLADHVYTLTEPMREELQSRGVPRAKIDLLPNSCDPARFVPRARDAALAARLGIPDGVPVVGYIGTFVDYEGLEDLALACALLKQRGVTFRLMLVGNENASGTDRGPITEQILRIAEAEGMTDWLIMPGRVPHEEVESYYSLIDIAPFPRKPWPVCEMVSPMKPLEALAMEKAVLVSSVRALTEMIADGQTGRVFDKGSVASLADRLQELIADPAQRLALGRQGRTWVSAERTWTAIGERIRETLSARLGARYTAPARRAAAPAATPAGHAAAAPAAVAAAPRPRWWAKVDPAFRERCAFVDIGGWAPAADVGALRARYVARFGEEAVARRMPAANWSRADICERTVEPGSALLDVGSGLGEFVNLVARRGRHGPVTSVDRKDYDLWMDDTGTLQRIHRDLFELDDSCAREVVTCFEVIEHLPPERVAEAVALLRRLARRKLYVSVPFMEGPPLYKGHFTRFDHANLGALFPDARFTVFGRSDKDEVHAWILCDIDVAPGA